jgi:hypothetical protein
MRFLNLLLLSVFVSTILGGCSLVSDKSAKEIQSAGSQKASATAPVFKELIYWLAKNRLAVNIGQNERIDYDGAFAQGAIIAYGEGSPSADAESLGQKRLTALRAAEVVAQRNLADFLAKRAMSGELRFTTATVQLETFLNGAVMVASEYNHEKGRAAALVKLGLNGAKGFSVK